MAIANFPSLAPTTRAWTPGIPPSSRFSSLNGKEVRILHGTTPVNTTLVLQFENLTEANAKLITDHYELARGPFEIFSLPAQVYAGLSVYNNIQPALTNWRYSTTPSVTYPSPGIVSVSVELVAVF